MTKVFLAYSLLLAVACVSKGFSNGNSTTVKSDHGIQFFSGTWEEALQKSTTEQKPIFLTIYASHSYYCKQLKQFTFTNKKVAEYFNTNFINVSFDGENTEGSVLAKKYEMIAYPSLFIIDESGTLITSTVGYKTPEQLIDFGQSGIKKHE